MDRSEEFPPPPDIISLRCVSGALFTVSLYFRMMVALGTSLWIGVKNFHHPQTSSACVVFQELCLQLAYIFQDDGCLGYIPVDRSEEFPLPPDIISLCHVSEALFTVSQYISG